MASRSYETYILKSWQRPKSSPNIVSNESCLPLKTFCKECRFFQIFCALRSYELSKNGRSLNHFGSFKDDDYLSHWFLPFALAVPVLLGMAELG
jgi:hypothetical protein